MAHDQILAGRVRARLETRGDLTERNMMGLLCFMVNGHMTCGVTGANLMVRVGPDEQDEALADPRVRLMNIKDKHVPGFVVVNVAGMLEDAVGGWIDRGLAFTTTLPDKAPRGKRGGKH